MPKAKGEPIFAELSSIVELGRLACAFERVPRPVFGISIDESQHKYALAVHSEQIGDAPVFFYALSDKIDQFLRYKVDEEAEEVTFSPEAFDPRYLYSPILLIKEVPEVFKKAIGRVLGLSELTQRFQLGDVVSLLKLSSYRLLADEAPAPLYLSKSDDKYHLGAFVHIGDSDGSDLYFYTLLDSDPGKNFVKYNPQKPSDWGFTNRAGDHGTYYAKIVRIMQDKTQSS
ncbi:MAG: hypothetical protein QXX17_05080 [Conexivisphaerales archaeon]